jgi:predicted PurR-regulated permease PerM
VFAALVVLVITVAAIGGLLYLLLPPLIDQIAEFVDAVPGLVEELTRGEGPLGFLERDYQIVERIRAALEDRGVGGVLGLTTPALSIAQSVVTAVVGVVAIVFLTLFMLIDGPRLHRSVADLLPEGPRARWERMAQGIYKTVGGYVSGNLVISFIAFIGALIILLATGVPYSVPLALVAGIFDLVPLAGATIAAVIIVTVATITKGWVIGLIVAVVFLVYQQFENHVLQPLIYGRTVQLSPLVVLAAVLIGAELAGIVGALGAIPVAGAIQVILREYLAARRERAARAEAERPL